MHDLIIYGIATIIILVAVICFIVTMRRNKGKEQADEFIEGLAEEMVKIAMSIIQGFDPSKYETIEEFETACLSEIYTKMWEFVSTEAREKLEEGSLLRLAFEYINADTVIKILDKLFAETNVFSSVQNRYAEYNLENKQEAPTEVYQESEYYEDTESSEEDLANQEETVSVAEAATQTLAAIQDTEPVEQEIIPPREEEEVFNAEDDSMELLPDDNAPESQIIIQTDKNGKERYYEITSDGKKKQVKKEYALSQMNKEG